MFVLTKVSCRRFRVVLMALFPLSAFSFQAFSSGSNLLKYQRFSPLHVTTTSPEDPQVLAAGYSQAINMNEALQEATEMALQALPKAKKNSKIDLAVVSVSSLYDGNASPSDVVPTVLEAASTYGKGIQNLVGSTAGGFISSAANLDGEVLADDDEDERIARGCLPIEREGVPGVSVTLCVLPDVTVKTFHVIGDDVPDDFGRMSPDMWKQSVGLGGFQSSEEDNAAVFLLPSPAFQNELDDFTRGLESQYPSAKVFGAIASTVSSLSRARLFRHDSSEDCVQTLADGCVGVAMAGDIEIKTMVAQGAKPVGGVYQIVKGEESTIAAIALDEAATELVKEAEDIDEGEDSDEDDIDDADTKAKIAAAYAKARIPKPVLAEANFLMRTLSDDDQSFMRKALLVGLERGGSVGRTPSELARLAEGKGHRFTVHQVASAAMKDGSITLSLGSVNVKPGTRFRFYVRESTFAKKEVEALWLGHKKRVLTETMQGSSSFSPTGCFLFPTLDRGSKFFLGKAGFESNAASQFLPTVPCISGFFSNGVIGALESDPNTNITEPTSLYGSASGYVLFGSKSGRPVYSPSKAAAEEKDEVRNAQEELIEEGYIEAEKDGSQKPLSKFDLEKKAPRDKNGELVLKRREVHSGRALTVSTVEWSVAEKTATPTSALEGFMWDKETEVDRFRERVPLANLVSQCRLSTADPSLPKPRDWIGPVKEAAAGGKFVIIPECKRVEPTTGSLRKRYDLSKIVKDFTLAGVPAVSVNCDGVLFGGSLEDLTTAREAISKAALEVESADDGVIVPPILASDLLLYPYQLYKMRLAGADAVNLVVGALAAKDLLYLTKIASSLQMQTLLTVTSSVQIQNLNILSPGSIDGLIVSNRELEDFSFDMTGKRALGMLQGEALQELREKHGKDLPVFVDGRVGIIAIKNDEGEKSSSEYLNQLKMAGATGAIVGAGLVPDETGKSSLDALLQLC